MSIITPLALPYFAWAASHNAGTDIMSLQSCFVLTLPKHTEWEETEKKKKGGMQWYSKAQLFTSHQAQRSQRHNMSQHAKQCKLEHPRFPETEQRKE